MPDLLFNRYFILFCLILRMLTPFTRSAFFPQASGNTLHEANSNNNRVSYHNLTNKDIADLLRVRGYAIREFPGEKPLVLMGDVAYHPEQILPELAEGRYTGITGSRIWMEKGVAKLWYFFDIDSNADRNLLKAAVKTWAEATCIHFQQLPDAGCSKNTKHGSICVGNYGGCWSMIGNIHKKGGEAQKMSVEPRGCELVAAAHEFGHALGNQHQQSRPDRDHFMDVKYENFECPLEQSKRRHTLPHTWAQGGRCNRDQVVDLPVPFDYMSLMQYMTSAFADKDQRPVFVTKDGHLQYILDYHRHAGMVQSFYDQYSVNTVYGCVNKWTAKCTANKKHALKCKNMGFVGKHCKCYCPPAFKGSACETQTSPLFPLLAKANMVDVTNNQLVDWSKYKMRPDKGDGLLQRFSLYQYFSIIAHGSDERQRVILHTLPLKLPSTLTNHYIQSWVLKHIDVMDCLEGIRVLWGLSERGNLRRECMSTMANNEPSGPIFRSRSNHLDFIYFSSMGKAGSRPKITIHLMQYKMQFTFEDSPLKHLKAKKAAGPKPGSSGDGGDSHGGANDTGTAAQVDAQKTKNIGIGISIAVLMLLLLGTGAGSLVWYQRKQVEDGGDGDKVAEEALGESETSAPATSSDDDYADANAGTEQAHQQQYA